jgi:hypothetical protein
MANDYVATVALQQESVDSALKALGERVTAISMSNATHGAELASMQLVVDRLESELSMGTTQVGLMYAQVNKMAASLGMLRAEIAGARVMHDGMQIDMLGLLKKSYSWIVAFCVAAGLSLSVLAVALWFK